MSSETKPIGRISLSSRPSDADAGEAQNPRFARMETEIKNFGERLLLAKEALRDLRVRAAREEAKGSTGPEMSELYDEIRAGVGSVSALEEALERVITRAKQSRLSEHDVQELVSLVREARSARPMGITVPGGRTIYYYYEPFREPRSFAEVASDITLRAVRRVPGYLLSGPNGVGLGRPFFAESRGSDRTATLEKFLGEIRRLGEVLRTARAELIAAVEARTPEGRPLDFDRISRLEDNAARAWKGFELEAAKAAAAGFDAGQRARIKKLVGDIFREAGILPQTARGAATGAGRGPVQFMMPLAAAAPIFNPTMIATGGFSMMPSILGMTGMMRPMMF